MPAADLIDLLLYSCDPALAAAAKKAAADEYLVRVAENPERLQAALHDFTPDLILLHAPSDADVELLAALKERHPLPEAILLLDAAGIERKELRGRFLALGIGQYIPMPVEPRELFRRLEQYFRENPRRVNPLQTRRLYRAGEPVYIENETGSECYEIVSGRVRVCRVIDRHTLMDIGELGPGTFFGEMALLGAPRRTEVAIARDDVLVQVSTRERFTEVARVDPSFGVQLIRMLGERLRALQDQLAKPLAPQPDKVAPLRGEEAGESERRFVAGAPLFEPGERASFCYIVLRGAVRKLGVDGAPGDAGAGLIGEGQAVGDVPFLTGFPHTHRILAHEETICFVLNKNTLPHAVRRYPELYFKMAQGMAAMILARLDRVTRSQFRELA